MAQKVVVQYLDDLDNELVADETVTFSLDGVTYEIDLTAGHAAQLRDTVQPYADQGRRTGGRRRSGRTGGSSAEGPTAEHKQRQRDIRDWARKNGYKVSDRGRIAQTIQADYDKAHGSA